MAAGPKTSEPHQTDRTMDLEITLARATDLMNSDQLENEAQVKQYVILPIVRALGWDDADPRMVKPEYKVDHGYVDYALLDHGAPHVFIEAKRIGVRLESGEDQLFRYAANMGVPLLILTDGRRWDFYLSMAPGVPKERRFFRMRLSRKTDVSKNAGLLEEFVQRDRVVSGESRRSGRRILEWKRLRERTWSEIPRAWKGLLREHNSLLVRMISEQVADVCRSAPTPDDIKTFLNARAQIATPPELYPPKPVRFKKVPPKPDPDPPVDPPKHSRIVGFEFRGREYRTKSGIRALVEIVKLFDSLHPGFMTRLETKTTGRIRKLVARKRSELYTQTRLVEKCSIDLGNGWWLGSHLQSKQIRRHAQTACEIAGVKFGAELRFIEQPLE